MQLKVKRTNKNAQLPIWGSKFAAAFDLSSSEEVSIKSGETVAVDIGLAFEVPSGYYLEICPRSGLSLNTSLRIANSPGIVDEDFRGTVKVLMTNSMTRFPSTEIITKGQRIAQALLKKVEQAEIIEVEELSTTERGESGFGSSGK